MKPRSLHDRRSAPRANATDRRIRVELGDDEGVQTARNNPTELRGRSPAMPRLRIPVTDLCQAPPAKGGSESRGVLRRWEFLPTLTMGPRVPRAALGAGREGTPVAESSVETATPAVEIDRRVLRRYQLTDDD